MEILEVILCPVYGWLKIWNIHSCIYTGKNRMDTERYTDRLQREQIQRRDDQRSREKWEEGWCQVQKFKSALVFSQGDFIAKCHTPLLLYLNNIDSAFCFHFVLPLWNHLGLMHFDLTCRERQHNEESDDYATGDACPRGRIPTSLHWSFPFLNSHCIIRKTFSYKWFLVQLFSDSE